MNIHKQNGPGCGCIHFSGTFRVGCWVDSYPLGADVTIRDHADPTRTWWTGTTVSVPGVPGVAFVGTIAGPTPLVVDITCTKGADTVTQTFTLHCGDNHPALAVVKVRTTVHVLGCTGALPDATVVVTYPDSTTATFNTDPSGNAYLGELPHGTYSGSVSYARFAVATFSFDIVACCTYEDNADCSRTVTVPLTPDTGYYCWCDANVPVLGTLHGTLLGQPYTAVFNQNYNGTGFGAWVTGFFTVTVPAGTAGTSDCCAGQAGGTAALSLRFCSSHPGDGFGTVPPYTNQVEFQFGGWPCAGLTPNGDSIYFLGSGFTGPANEAPAFSQGFEIKIVEPPSTGMPAGCETTFTGGTTTE